MTGRTRVYDRPHPMVTIEEQLAQIAKDQSRGAIAIEEAEARRRMARAGVEPPAPCRCERPVIDRDVDGDPNCVLCGRRPA